MARVEDNKLKKRTKIINAAYDLFLNNGINTTAIDEVVKKAGVAKGTFYLYFRDKYDLFDQVIFLKTAAIIKELLEKVKKEGQTAEMSYVDRIILFVDMVIDYLCANREVVMLIDQKLSAFYEMLMYEQDNEWKDVIDELLGLLMSTGYTKEESQKHLYIMTNMIGSVCCTAILCKKPYEIEEIKPELHTLIRKMLSPSKGSI